MPQPGEILYYKNWKFEDGSERDKLFVALNTSNVDDPCLFLITTSQSKRYSDVKPGCNPPKRVFFVTKDTEVCFDKNTYVKLPQIIEIPTTQLLQDTFSKRAYIQKSLTPISFAQLKNCLKKFELDIPQRHRELIFHK